MSCVTTLKAKGLKLTPQRMLIVEIIHHDTGHLTAEEIISNVQARMPGVNKSTVYRTLDLLEEAGCIYKSEIGSDFIYHHDEEGHHHHLICRQCGKTIECAENLFAPLKKLLDDKYNFNAEFKHVIINGLCVDCSRRE
jgi:Fur family transcriptional regulator, ferric uptake regulator